MGSWLIIVAPIPLALGIAGDLYVATFKASESALIGMTLALIVSAILGMGTLFISGQAIRDAECARQDLIGYKLRLDGETMSYSRGAVTCYDHCAAPLSPGAASSWHLWHAVVQVLGT
jgi:hypothetical protein